MPRMKANTLIFINLFAHTQLVWSFLCNSGAINGRSLTRPSPSIIIGANTYNVSPSRVAPQHTYLLSDRYLGDISQSSSSSLSGISSALLASSDVESWRQYIPLVVSVGVIIDILLGSPLANMALGPMKRASEKGNSEDASGENSNGGNSLFSTFGNGTSGGASRSKERVDSEAIARAAIDKAQNTLELKRFLEENKTNEQKYDEIRRKIDKQMDELDEAGI